MAAESPRHRDRPHRRIVDGVVPAERNDFAALAENLLCVSSAMAAEATGFAVHQAIFRVTNSVWPVTERFLLRKRESSSL